MSIQMPPVGIEDEQFVRFSYKTVSDPTWTETDSSVIDPVTYQAHIRMDDWNSTVEKQYRISYRLRDEKGRMRTYFYSGKIKPDPVEKVTLNAGAFSCISHMEGSIDGTRCDYPDRIWFPHTDFVESVKAQNPDILFFTGDQIYEGRPTAPDLSSQENTRLDYLYKWYLFLWTTGDLLRNTPAVIIPDDHDVYQGNLWGANGKAVPSAPSDSSYPDYYKGREKYWRQDQGGYILDPSVVNMIQSTQTSHLPDPYDATPVEQGIQVYYTDLIYGRVSFAILEDRKFKSAPGAMVPEAKVVNGFPQNRYMSGWRMDNPDATLLGERQLAFIDDWTTDWKDADLKAAISQTLLVNLSTFPASFTTDEGLASLPSPPAGVIPEGYRLAKDMDSNGWPQTGRNNALKALRKGYAVMISGDQHLGSLTRMGTDRWNDAGYAFSVPAVGNLWPRRWFPPETGKEHQEGQPPYTGQYYDGFGNKVTVIAVANPELTDQKPGALYNRAVGYGIIKFEKPTGNITFECWKRNADPEKGEEDMYSGWPKTINLMDNYDRPIRTWLPPYIIKGLDNHPVFQVIDEENGEILYTVRVPSYRFQPGVFAYGGEYTVRIGDPDTENFREFNHVKARYNKPTETEIVQF